MRHQSESKRVGRPRGQHIALLRTLAASVILYESVRTTRAKAKLVKPVVERLITKAKKGNAVSAIRELNRFLIDQKASQKVMKELVPRYKERSSGYLRVTALGFRSGDAAPMVRIELV